MRAHIRDKKLPDNRTNIRKTTQRQAFEPDKHRTKPGKSDNGDYWKTGGRDWEGCLYHYHDRGIPLSSRVYKEPGVTGPQKLPLSGERLFGLPRRGRSLRAATAERGLRMRHSPDAGPDRPEDRFWRAKLGMQYCIKRARADKLRAPARGILLVRANTTARGRRGWQHDGC